VLRANLLTCYPILVGSFDFLEIMYYFQCLVFQFLLPAQNVVWMHERKCSGSLCSGQIFNIHADGPDLGRFQIGKASTYLPHRSSFFFFVSLLAQLILCANVIA
jgi:hypothetical protein